MADSPSGSDDQAEPAPPPASPARSDDPPAPDDGTADAGGGGEGDASAGGDSDGGGGHSSRLTLYIVIGIVAAIVTALAAPAFAAKLYVGGEIFLRLLKMVVVPLVVASVMSGILGLGDVRKLGKPGGYAILYYLSTTILAVIVGLIVVNIIRPGKRDADKFVKTPTLDKRREDIRKVIADEAQLPPGHISALLTALLPDSERADPSDARSVLDALAKKTALTPAEIAAVLPALEFGLEDSDAKPRKHTDEDAARIILTAIQKELAADEETLNLSKKEIAAIIAELKPGLEEEKDIGAILENMMLMLFTDNLFDSALNTKLLPLIAFSIIFAGMLTTMGRRVDTLTNMISQVNDALMSFVLLLMKVAPLGIFCLVAARFGKARVEGNFIEELASTAWYSVSVLSGLSIHAFVTLPAIYWFFTRKNPYVYILRMSQAILTAFSTASSSATLPVTMETATKRAGVSKRSVEFVLPLGATINMDGTALYEAVAAIFIANVVGMELTFMDQIVIALTATLAAIGAAGIPEAGLITMLIVLNAVGLPVEGIGVILAVDWLLDRFRTAVNVTGDAIGAAVVELAFPPEEDDADEGGG